MPHSIFMDKAACPSAIDLQKALGESYTWWQQIETYVLTSPQSAVAEWNFASPKYGWSFRLKDKKRVIVYLLPRDGFFKAAFVFGQKATDEILSGDFPDFIKNELKSARVYAEGRGIKIDVNQSGTTKSIENLIDVKMKF